MKKLILAAALIIIAAPAFAGSLSFSNGKGMWQSTLCSRPVPPAFVGLGADSSASTLNAATASYNTFVKQSQDYQTCLSAEAKSDGESANGLISQMVDRQMQDAQLEVERAKGQLFGRNAPSAVASQPSGPRGMPQPTAQQPQPMIQPTVIEGPSAIGQPTQLQPVSSQPMMQQQYQQPQPALQIPQPASPQPLQPPQYQYQQQPQPSQAPATAYQPLDHD
jgi:hypothetical protein